MIVSIIKYFLSVRIAIINHVMILVSVNMSFSFFFQIKKHECVAV